MAQNKGDSEYIKSLVDQASATVAQSSGVYDDGAARSKLLQLSKEITTALQTPDDVVANLAHYVSRVITIVDTRS